MLTKKMNFLVMGMLVAFSTLFSSCNDDYRYVVVQGKGYKSWFTVKVEDGSFYFLHDNGKTFLPVSGLHHYSPTKDHRAFVYYEVALEGDSKEYNYPIRVHYMDTILSKKPVENLYEENESVYGKDPVDIEQMWVGGGFLNIKFVTLWGGWKTHFVNLVAENDDNPYELTFRHNSYDDPKYNWGYGWVAFDLSELPPTGNEDGTVELVVKVETFKGMIEKKFTYTPGIQNEEDPGEDDEESDDDPGLDRVLLN